MKQYRLTFKTITPVMIGEHRTTQNSQSLDYIPGATLLGGLAYAYLRQKKLSPEQKDASFDRFFLEDQVRIGNFYPANFSSFLSLDVPVKPLPTTARSCKRWEGFKYQAQEECHGVVDHLIFWSLFKLSGNLNIFNEKNRYCQDCQRERIDVFHGFYRRYGPGQYKRADVNTRLVMGTGINRLTGTVEEEILFSREVIAEAGPDGEAQVFQGRIALDESVEQDFLDFLTSPTLHLRIGQAKTRGLGRLQLESPGQGRKPVPPISLKDFKDRLTQFDDAVKTQAKVYGFSLDDSFWFAVTCCSDAIIRANDLRYKTSLTANDMATQLKVGENDIQFVYHDASVVKIRGWNTLWRLPKTVELAISKGSVFMFTYTKTPDDPFFQALYDLEQEGIGSRKAEGFGWIVISDEFHQEVTQI
jgi:CRISPR-associated protein Csx10